MQVEYIINNGVGKGFNEVKFNREEGKYKGNKLISKVINYNVESGDKVVINVANSEDVNIIYDSYGKVIEIQLFKKI